MLTDILKVRVEQETHIMAGKGQPPAKISSHAASPDDGITSLHLRYEIFMIDINVNS